MTDALVLAVLVLALVCINAFVSWRVAKSALFERPQVIRQVVLVWLVPIVGALLVGLFLRNEEHVSATPRSGDEINTDEIGTLLDSPLTGHHHHD